VGTVIRISFGPTWQLLPGPLRARLLFWAALTILALMSLDWAGVIWIVRAPVIAGWDRCLLSTALAGLALFGAVQARAIFRACGSQAPAQSSRAICPGCKSILMPLMASPHGLNVCTRCERAWEVGGREIDWP
jgi:hypothetical protein